MKPTPEPVKQPDKIDVEVGRRVRLQRKQLGMTQVQLAAGLGITFQQVQKYERGSNRIGASRLSEIAKILRVRVSYFFEEALLASDDGTEAPTDITSFLATKEGVALNEAFQAIRDPQRRKSLVSLIRAIAESDV